MSDDFMNQWISNHTRKYPKLMVGFEYFIFKLFPLLSSIFDGRSCGLVIFKWDKDKFADKQTSQNSLFKIPLPSYPSDPLIRNPQIYITLHLCCKPLKCSIFRCESISRNDLLVFVNIQKLDAYACTTISRNNQWA